MPNFTGTPQQSKTATTLLKDAAGDNSTPSLDGINVAATQAQIDAYFDALADLTNAGVVSNKTVLSREVSIPNVTAFDEALSSVTNTAVFTFQNDTLDTRETTIPAPDLSIFQGDGINVDLTNADVATYVAATKVLLNAGSPAGTYEIVRGVRGDTRRKRGQRRSRPQITEPGVGEKPGGAPGA